MQEGSENIGIINLENIGIINLENIGIINLGKSVKVQYKYCKSFI